MIFISITIFFIFISTSVFYILYLIEFFYKKISLKIIKKNKKIIKLKKNTIEIKKNVYLTFLKQIIINQSNMKAFLLLYSQIQLVKNFEKQKNIIETIKIIVYKITFRMLILTITGIPLIIIKNTNFVLKNIQDVMIFKKTKLNIKIKTIILNLIVKYNINLTLKTFKNKIILKKNKIELNMKEEEFEILKNMIDIKLWVQSSNNLLNNGVLTKMRYFTYDNRNIPFHPTIYFNNYKENEILVSNQTTKKSLEILEKFNQIKFLENITNKRKIELKLEIQKIFEKGNAYMTIPHIVKEEDIILGDASKLILNLNNPKNVITKFKFIQSFFLNFEFEIFRHDPNNGLTIDNNYLNVKNYLEKNINGFKPEIRKEFENLLEFYEKNKNFLKQNKINFLELLNKADTNIDIKNYFLKIIEENTNN